MENPLSTIPQVQPTPKVVDSILTLQLVSTRRGGYHKFLVKWASKPNSEAMWLQGSEVHHLYPQFLQDYTKHYLPKTSCLVREEIDASSNDQDKDIRKKVKVKKQIEPNKRKNDAKADNYIDASSNELNILCKLRFQQCILTKQCLLTGNSS